MDKLLINFENCYWINKLKYDFDFSGNKRTYLIYAPNGIMKSSFAKTFKNKESKDLVFPHRVTLRYIKDELSNDISSDNIFVIDPYNSEFNSDKISTLVVKKELKEKYDIIYKDLWNEKNEFIKKLKGISQSSDCELELFNTFSSKDKETFFEILEKCEKLINPKFLKYNFKYNDIFDKTWKVEKFLQKNSHELDEYIRNYDSLISTSTFFQKNDNSFWTYQANSILESISDNSFFEAGHYLELSDKTAIHSKDEYQAKLELEIAKISSDDKLVKVFKKIDKAIWWNIELRAFKAVIEKDNLLLVKLKDYQNFKKEVWLWYLLELKKDIGELLVSYNLNKKKLQDIIDEAKRTKTAWENAVGLFNQRFNGLPFKLEIQNKEDVILKIDTPSMGFIFEDGTENQSISREDLFNILSQWERRALYLVNIIFEIEARRIQNIDTIFIIDDIADSFDYKNKYAIIEYLKDISQEKDSNFYQIILTHNFDFFRSIQWRVLWNKWMKNCLIASKNKGKLILECIEKKWLINPFMNWKEKVISNNVDKIKYLIALIPFIRNIIEYTVWQKSKSYLILTHLLHKKNTKVYVDIWEISKTEVFKFSDLEDIYQIIMPNIKITESENILTSLYLIADQICNLGSSDSLVLENKILLSMAARLRTEEYLIKNISNDSFVNSINADQLNPLVAEFQRLYSHKAKEIEICKQVQLMTPENIHLNSFMYEPILDMPDDHLKFLYFNIKKYLK